LPGPGDRPLARLHGVLRAWSRLSQPMGRVRTVKKLLLLALVGLGIFAVWRKVQADRAELDLWTEATTSDD
jgi:hypothetical protein